MSVKFDSVIVDRLGHTSCMMSARARVLSMHVLREKCNNVGFVDFHIVNENNLK